MPKEMGWAEDILGIVMNWGQWGAGDGYCG